MQRKADQADLGKRLQGKHQLRSGDAKLLHDLARIDRADRQGGLFIDFPEQIRAHLQRPELFPEHAALQAADLRTRAHLPDPVCLARQDISIDQDNLLPDILMWGAAKYDEKPDFAVYNIGGIRAALAKGTVTYGDVVDVAPFENKICFLTLSGEKVIELFQQIAARAGEGLSHGVQLTITPDSQLVSVTINGSPIDKNRSYRIATLDYLSQGNDGMDAFKSHTNLVSPQSEDNNIRYIIIDYFRDKMAKGQDVDTQLEGRVAVKN